MAMTRPRDAPLPHAPGGWNVRPRVAAAAVWARRRQSGRDMARRDSPLPPPQPFHPPCHPCLPTGSVACCLPRSTTRRRRRAGRVCGRPACRGGGGGTCKQPRRRRYHCATRPPGPSWRCARRGAVWLADAVNDASEPGGGGTCPRRRRAGTGRVAATAASVCMLDGLAGGRLGGRPGGAGNVQGGEGCK